jgi:hypothetical protein
VLAYASGGRETGEKEPPGEAKSLVPFRRSIVK